MVDICNDADTVGFFGKFGSSFDFGKHGAGFEIAFLDVFGEFFGGNLVDGLGVWLSEVNIGIGYRSDGDENVGVDFFGEAFGGEIFVNDGIDAFEAF